MKIANTKESLEQFANRFVLNYVATDEAWNPYYWTLIPNGFIIKNQQYQKAEKFVFDFKKQTYKRSYFIKQPGSSKLIETKPQTYKVPQDFGMLAKIDLDRTRDYPELNHKNPGDKKFFVELVVDGYIDPETQEWMDERSQEDDYDYRDDEFDNLDYQKVEIYTLWAPNRKIINNWSDNKDFQDLEGNVGWIGGVISLEELTPLKTKEAIK